MACSTPGEVMIGTVFLMGEPETSLTNCRVEKAIFLFL